MNCHEKRNMILEKYGVFIEGIMRGGVILCKF